MIEVNLVPDVKLELLKARRQRAMVISGSIITSIVAASVVVLLLAYTYGVQAALDTIANDKIASESKKLSEVKDLSKTLTIQSQLEGISSMYDSKNVTSRIFDIVSVTVPEGKNSISVRRLAFDGTEKQITIEGQALNGYEALEVFKKTIAETKFAYKSNGNDEQQSVNIAKSISDGERTYSEDDDGKQVLRFTVTFVFADELFSTTSLDGKVIGPDKQKATDSSQGVPSSLFEGGSQ